MNKEEWKLSAIKLYKTGFFSKRGIAKLVNVPRSTVLDYLKKYDDVSCDVKHVEDNKPATHLFIPDSHVKPGISLDYLDWVGQYIVRKRPDVVIHAGDFADMESLSSYDMGKRAAEGKRVNADIKAAKEGMAVLLAPLRKLQKEQEECGEAVYKPRLVLTIGNHEDRIVRHVNANPELHGFLSIESLGYKEAGWEVVPYLTPIKINGVNYVHYFQNVMTGKPLAGTAANMLKTIGESFTMGHRQVLDVSTRFLPASGQQQWGLICGGCYMHQEDYKGVQGNKHFRGIVLKHNVHNGSYDPLFVSLDWLEKEYGSKGVVNV